MRMQPHRFAAKLAARLFEMPIAISLLGIFTMTANAALAAPLVSGRENSPAFFLLIDHSGSMNTTDEKPSRWERVKSEAIDFVSKQIPLGAQVWIELFEDQSDQGAFVPFKVIKQPFNSEEDRAAIIKRIRECPAPAMDRPIKGENDKTQMAGPSTWLYEAINWALGEAERLATKNPQRFICVRVYTDGEDEGSPKEKPDSLTATFKRIRELDRHLWFFYVKVASEPQSNPIRDAHSRDGNRDATVITLGTEEKILANAALNPRQRDVPVIVKTDSGLLMV